jgi:hypothetical protein
MPDQRRCHADAGRGLGIVILTGAGVSAESGLGTFRDKDGLWTPVRPGEVATPEGFAARNPRWCTISTTRGGPMRSSAAPNAAHEALARLTSALSGRRDAGDAEHRRPARARRARWAVIHMHGEITRALCAACEARWDAPRVMDPDDACPACGARRPGPTSSGSGRCPTTWTGSPRRWRGRSLRGHRHLGRGLPGGGLRRHRRRGRGRNAGDQPRADAGAGRFDRVI